MQIRRTTGFLILSLMTAFFLAACGGGSDGDSSPDLTPSVTTVPASSVTNTSAVLNATVNPKGLATTAWFEYSEDPALAANVTSTAPQALGSGSTDNAITQSISGLQFAHTYYFRAKATSSAGTKNGAIVQFSTLPQPTVTTNPADAITTTGADLNAIVNPNGRDTTAWFEYGKTGALGTSTDNQLLGNGVDNVIVTETLSGLDVATEYFFRVVASSSAGTSNGTTLSFTTAGGVPLVTTKAATSVTTTGGVLNADVNPSGLATDAWFEYGTDNTFAFFTKTDNQAMGAGTSAVPIPPTTIDGFKLGDIIYYRVAAANSQGPSLKGEVFSFKTLDPPPKANAGTDQSVYTRSATGATVVTLDGSGSAADPLKEIDSYLWTQLPGTGVTLDDDTFETPSFTAMALAYGAPSENLAFEVTVTDNTGLTATDNVNVIVNWGFFDDFSTDTTATYSVAKSPPGNSGGFFHDAGFEVADIITGAPGITNSISHLYSFGGGNGTDTGEFTVDIWPFQSFGAGEGVEIAIGDTAATYIRISTLLGSVEKYRAGALIDNQALTGVPTMGTWNPVKITFTRSVTTVVAFGETVTLEGGDFPVPMSYFSALAQDMNVSFDNLKLAIHP